MDRGILDCTDTKSLWIGTEYDYSALCKPSWPFCRGDKKREAPPFFGVKDPLSILLGAVFGLQHTLAMVGGETLPALPGVSKGLRAAMCINRHILATGYCQQIKHAVYSPGLITPPLLLAQMSPDPATRNYLVSSSLIISGICTLFHVTSFRIPGTRYYFGSGIVSVCGFASSCGTLHYMCNMNSILNPSTHYYSCFGH